MMNAEENMDAEATMMYFDDEPISNEETQVGSLIHPKTRQVMCSRSVLVALTLLSASLVIFAKTHKGSDDETNGQTAMATAPPTHGQPRDSKGLYPGYYRKPKNETEHARDGTPAPTVDTSVLPNTTSDCVDTRERLLTAVDAYLFLLNNNDNNSSPKTTLLPISDWCVNGNQILDFSRLFDYNRNPLAGTFDEPLNDWNLTGATSLAQMFQGARLFNQPLDQWDTRQVRSLRGTFFGADQFNQPLASWDTSSCITFASAFRSADAFNQDLSEWDLSKAIDMTHVLEGAQEFRQNLCNWQDQLRPRSDLSAVRFQDAFLGTACPSQHAPSIHKVEPTATTTPTTGQDEAAATPVYTIDSQGPFCFVCDDGMQS